MSPRPYAIVAYRPASSTADTVRSMKRATPSLRAARVHGNALGARDVLRVDDRRAAVGQVLLDDEGVLDLLPDVGLELDRAARQQRLELRLRERLAHRLAIRRAGLLDRREED